MVEPNSSLKIGEYSSHLVVSCSKIGSRLRYAQGVSDHPVTGKSHHALFLAWAEELMEGACCYPVSRFSLHVRRLIDGGPSMVGADKSSGMARNDPGEEHGVD